MSAGGRRRSNGTAARQQQRGAVAVFVAIAIVALVASLMLVINIGRLYYTQRQLQLDANMAALAGAQAGSGCLSNSKGVPGDAKSIIDAVRQSLQNNTPANTNSLSYLGVPTVPDALAPDGFIVTSLAGAAGLDARVQVGRTVLSKDGLSKDGLNNTFDPMGVDDPGRDSVRVTLATPAPSPWWPMSGTTKTLYASATAKQSNLGTFSIGTGLLDIDTDQSELLNSLLGGLLGTTVNLSVADYKRLAGAAVSLAQLGAQLALAPINSDGSPGPLLTSNVPVASLIGAILQSAGSGLVGTVGAGAQGSLQLEKALGISGVISNTVTNLPINAAQLLLTAAQIVGRNKPIALQVPINAGPVLSAGVFLAVTQPPQIGFGPPGKDINGKYFTLTKSAQVALSVRAAGLQLLGSSLNLGVDAELGEGTAGLDSLTCPISTSPSHAEITAIPDAVTLSAGSFKGNAATSPPKALAPGPILDVRVLFVPVLSIDLKSVASAKSGDPKGGQAEFDAPFPSDAHRVATGLELSTLTSTLTENFLGQLQVRVLGILPLPLGDILASLGGLLTPLVNVLDNNLLGPVLQLLGVQVGYADIKMLSATQGPPVIVTNCLPLTPGGNVGVHGNGCPPPASS